MFFEKSILGSLRRFFGGRQQSSRSPGITQVDQGAISSSAPSQHDPNERAFPTGWSATAKSSAEDKAVRTSDAAKFQTAPSFTLGVVYMSGDDLAHLKLTPGLLMCLAGSSCATNWTRMASGFSSV
jgi:hypothetical protein